MRVLFVSSGASPAVLAHEPLRALGCSVEWLDFSVACGGQKLGAWARHWPRPGAVAALCARLAAFTPDIVHVSGARQDLMAALIACRTFPKAPIVCERGAVGGLSAFSPLDWAMFRHPRLAAIIVPSRAVINAWAARPLLRRLMRAERCETAPLRRHSPAARGAPPSARASAPCWGSKMAAFVVGTVCAIRPIKNLGFAARAVASMRSARPVAFAVIGAPGDARAMRELVEAGGSRLRLLGMRPGAVSLMPALDAYVSPTRVPGEGFGLAFAEAMACGLPALTMNYGGSAEICEDGSSGFVLPEDLARWTTTLERLAGDGELAERVGEEARKRIARRFSPAAVAEAYLRIYEGAVSGGSAALARSHRGSDR